MTEDTSELRARILAKLRAARAANPAPPGSVAEVFREVVTDEELAELLATLPPDARERIFRLYPHVRP